MEVNRDEAERALSIAQRKWQAGDQAGGLRLARKSHALYPTELSKRLTEQYAQGGEKPAADSNSSSTTNNNGRATSTAKAQAAPQKEGLRSRKPAAASDSARTYTAEQLDAVTQVMRIKSDYYKVLGVGRTATDVEIKRAYRKSALVFHPDKNTAPGADEAFKLVAHAFTVLSDGDKRAHYDRFGADARSGGAAPAPQHPFDGVFGGARQRTADEISPEDLFNMFFGGDFGQFNVQFGPNGGIPRAGGVRFGRPPFGQRVPQQQQQAAGQTSFWASCMQLMPLVLLVLSFFASSLVSLFLGGDSAPAFAFERSPRHSSSRVTAARNVVYWVDSGEFSRSAIDRAPSQLWQFEREVEAQYISRLQRRCRQEREHKRNQIYMAQGWFGLGSDDQRMQAAQAIPLPACDELRRFR
ncbi:Chaperone protein dnaJ [Coemansia sp. RSA 2711]|nr:Chaperone protein dnaJ [Coemansia sp. RSA 2711]